MKASLTILLPALISTINAGTVLSYTQICTDNASCASATDTCCKATKTGSISTKLCAPANTYDADRNGVYEIPASFGTTKAGYAGYKWGCPRS